MSADRTPSPPPTATALVVSEPGGRDVLAVRDVPLAAPAPGEVTVAVEASGVNFIDVYRREGIYPTATPFVSGSEGAGTVVAVGPGASRWSVGDRVAWKEVPGSAATHVVAAQDELVAVPDTVDLETAAAVMLQGLTAHYLVTSTHPVRPGDVALVHAAAGGVGRLLVQMVTARGGTVVATAGTPEKLGIARDLGAAHAIDYREHADPEDLAAAVRAAAGRGVDVVYDGVGAATFDASLLSLRPRGLMVLFGGASGQVPPLDLQRLNRLGSLFVTRPSLGAYTADRAELEWRAAEVLGAVADASLDVHVGGRFPLADAAGAYADLEERRSTGKLLLLPRG